jgi:hypothetical protein
MDTQLAANWATQLVATKAVRKELLKAEYLELQMVVHLAAPLGKRWAGLTVR